MNLCLQREMRKREATYDLRILCRIEMVQLSILSKRSIFLYQHTRTTVIHIASALSSSHHQTYQHNGDLISFQSPTFLLLASNTPFRPWIQVPPPIPISLQGSEPRSHPTHPNLGLPLRQDPPPRLHPSPRAHPSPPLVARQVLPPWREADQRLPHGPYLLLFAKQFAL